MNTPIMIKPLSILKYLQTRMTAADKHGAFWHRSKLHFFLTNYLFLNMVNKNEINFVKIFDNIPRRIGARSTIFEVLQEGTECGFFIKEKTIKDKRKRIYSLSSDFFDYIKEGYEELSESEKIL